MSAVTPGRDVAAARFDSLADPARRMRLVHRAVRRHAAALKNRYPGLLMVTAGFRARRDENAYYAVHPEPCVLLTVREKWSGAASETAHAGDRLPDRLAVTATEEGRRVRYAVPTDVQPMAWLADVEPQHANGIEMSAPTRLNGAITCAVVVRSASPDQVFALSALHVLSPAPPLGELPVAGLPFVQSGSASVAGVSAPFGGTLRTDAPSLDAQLAQVTPQLLASAFDGLPRGPIAFARSRADVDRIAHTSQFVVLVPPNAPSHLGEPRMPVLAQFSGYADTSLFIEYRVTVNGQRFPVDLRFTELIIVAARSGMPVSEPGDSGSAVLVSSGNRALLVGMLIAGPKAGSDGGRMVILPSWSLFNPGNWAALPAGTRALLPAF